MAISRVLTDCAEKRCNRFVVNIGSMYETCARSEESE